MARQEQKKKRSVVSTLILIVALAVFCYSAYKLISIYLEYKAGSDEYKKIEQIAAPEKGYVNFDELEKINPDIVGWIYVDGTSINYPLVQGDTNETYLYTTFEKKDNIAGSIFLDANNKADFSKEPNIIIYGHHMKNGTMFRDLMEFLDGDFFKANRKVTVYTREKTYIYDIFSGYITDASSDTYALFSQEALGEDIFRTYVSKMSGKSDYQPNEKLTLDGESPVITLSTCTDADSARRTVVQGVLTETKKTVKP